LQSVLPRQWLRIRVLQSSLAINQLSPHFLFPYKKFISLIYVSHFVHFRCWRNRGIPSLTCAASVQFTSLVGALPGGILLPSTMNIRFSLLFRLQQREEKSYNNGETSSNMVEEKKPATVG